eukprot:TRINITY_DN73019_c0_g1_i1.p1 TRINITY_DN73019_c0_g1~~TRINITY_DN73019_c0_g1_i1.p1  ORF type:complete len:705 (-),score=230.26 TRINITY_DN73019_c0_g1_i1:94-2151(-)
MQRAICTSILALVAAASASQVTPVQKVLDMMAKLVEKGKAAMEEEKTGFDTYVKFCESATVEKGRRIAEAAERIEGLSASIDKAASDADQLTREIAEADAVIDASTAEKANATEVRKTEAADYAVLLKDYMDSIVAIGKAMAVLKQQGSSLPQAGAFVQLSKQIAHGKKISPTEASAFLDAFLRGRTGDEQPAKVPGSLLAESSFQPEEAGYDFSSDGVIGMLEKIEDQFKDEKMSLMKDELEKKNAYSTLVAGLDAENSHASRGKDRKTQERASILEQKAQDEAELEDVTASKKEDSKYKQDLEIDWKHKTTQFNSRQKLRKEELQAICQAIDIISGESVSGSAGKHLPSLLQAKRASALAFTGSERNNLRSPNVEKVVKLLQGKAQSLQSVELASLASRVKASPFAAVADMIKDLIAKKQAQGSAETTKQAWCEGELSGNNATRTGKTDELEGLQAGVDKLQATIQQIGDEVVDLKQQVSEMRTEMSEATSIRQKEKNENVATIADAKAAQAAVAQALSVLNEFYAKAGQATALVQASSVQPVPVAFSSKPYTGMGSESGGVIGMIEVIQSDFARLQTETTAAEQAAAKEYETFMSDSKLDVAGKEKDVEHKTAQAESLAQKVNTMKLDLANVQKELDAANQAFEVLKPQCADATASYEEQKAKREEEMKTLQQALDALNAVR